MRGMLFCYPSILYLFESQLLVKNGYAVLLLCDFVAVLLCCYGFLLLCDFVAVLLCCYGFLLLCGFVAVRFCCWQVGLGGGEMWRFV